MRKKKRERIRRRREIVRSIIRRREEKGVGIGKANYEKRRERGRRNK